jgi:hypothetical protein
MMRHGTPLTTMKDYTQAIPNTCAGPAFSNDENVRRKVCQPLLDLPGCWRGAAAKNTLGRQARAPAWHSLAGQPFLAQPQSQLLDGYAFAPCDRGYWLYCYHFCRPRCPPPKNCPAGRTSGETIAFETAFRSITQLPLAFCSIRAIAGWPRPDVFAFA